MRYGHIALSQWSSLPRGEEILSFALQSSDGHVACEDLLKFPGEKERKGWVERIVKDLMHSQEPTTIFYDHHLEGLLFEVMNFDHTLRLEHVEFLPQHQFRSPTFRSSVSPLAEAVEAIMSEATALLAHRKRAFKALQIARGELRWVEAFTDGSFAHQDLQGGAAFLRDDGAYGALRFPAENSNEPEFVAALIAISSARGEEKVSINSDSRHVVRALNRLIASTTGKQTYPTERVLTPLEEATLEALAEVVLPHQVRVRWVRGHCGNKMNNGADRLAKAMRKRRGRPTVPAAHGIVREATEVSAPVSYGFTANDLAVPDWYGTYLMNGEIDAEDAGEDRSVSSIWAGATGGDTWLARRASA